MPIVGTAGHVDHGKSTLVLALTGRDPDRWEEEKRRGLTIDLGFAWTTLPAVDDLPEVEVAFVDVPGHERFIRNMLAGIEAIDVALLVVAADEGWMPQSEEHLAVLDLLGVRHGVVAVTKADRVDEELLELAVLETAERLRGTSLEEAPLVAVSAPSGGGMDELRRALARAVHDSPPPPDLGRPRLWIDRSFTIAGAGTVVTGTLLDGSLDVGDRVAVWPADGEGTPLEARIRNLQSHERDRDRIGPGNRAAVNLGGLEREDIGRGSMLGLAGQWEVTDLVLVELRTARYVEDPLSDRGAYHLHVGSGTWPVELRLVEDEAIARRGAALLRLPTPLPLAMGDPFILREVGRRLVVGGGRVLDPAPPRRAAQARASLPTLLSAVAASPDQRAQALLAVREEARLAGLAAHTGGGLPARALVAGETALSPERADLLHREAVSLVRRHHAEAPLRPGISRASLASRLGVSLEVLDALVDRSPELRSEGAVVAEQGFRADLRPDHEEAWERARESLSDAGLTVPRIDQLDLGDELLHALLRQGRLVRISEDLAYLPEQLEEVVERTERMGDGFSVAEFRDSLGLTRKYAVPLLEWLDAQGVTIREGDLRRVRRHGPPRPAAGAAPSR